MKRASVFAFLLLALFFWRLGCQTGRPIHEGITLRCSVPLAAADYDEMTQREARSGYPASLALWTEKERQEVADGGRKTKAALVYVRGDVRLLFPAALAEGDVKGALVDKNTAIALFGMEDVSGAQIECAGKTRVIRAVIDTPLPTVVLMLEEGDQTPLENVTFQNGDQWEAFALRHGLDVALAVKNGAWRELADIFCVLPVICVFGWMLVLLTGAAIRCSYPTRKALFLLGIMILMTAGGLGLLYALPQRWIPPNWSDFGFWSGAAKEWKQETLELLATKKYRPDLTMMIQAGRAVGLEILSWIAVLAALKNIRPR